MKLTLLSGLVAIAFCAAVWAEDKPTTQPTSRPVNKMCAVNPDHPVDDRVTVQHNGQTVGFCCDDCVATFKESPEKYAKNLK